MPFIRTEGKSGVASSKLPVSFGNDDDFTSSEHMSIQYPKILRRDLDWELTTSVRQVNAKLAAGEKIDRVAKEFKLASQVCPGEQWTAKATDGVVSIEFSHPPDWNALGVHPTDIDPLTYQIKPIDRI